MAKLLLATIVLSMISIGLSAPTDIDSSMHKRISCSPEDTTCPKGRVCAGGRPDNMRCVKPMPEGGFCKGDPFWVCARGLACVGKVCVKAVKKGGSCVPPGSICEDGTVCAGGRPDNKRCVKPMPIGGVCKGDPFWVCEEGLECVNKVCVKEVRKGESCVPPNTVCEDGTVCAGGRPDNKRCVKPMPVGGRCKGDPFWVCEEGLVCKNQVCRRKIAVKGESCVAPTTKCMKGTVCAGGKPDNKRCVKPLAEGDFCKGDPFWVCDKGLECVREMCVKV